jgi:methyl-accepting chemotaxis protein
MSGDTGQLQKLTDQQVSARLAAYNSGGSLDRDLQMLREKAGDLIEAEVREQFGTEAAVAVKAHYAGNVDAAWISSAPARSSRKR